MVMLTNERSYNCYRKSFVAPSLGRGLLILSTCNGGGLMREGGSCTSQRNTLLVSKKRKKHTCVTLAYFLLWTMTITNVKIWETFYSLVGTSIDLQRNSLREELSRDQAVLDTTRKACREKFSLKLIFIWSSKDKHSREGDVEIV